ncbi:MAG: copper amine oxidase N-terminal domain-containing protein [Clostridiales bacterium]|jgi:hypothetical protein|nr:copper amine oxidase N-terminal domain-containing protein [Clostridiales bacterium]
MKRIKFLSALLAIASLTLASASFAFAAEVVVDDKAVVVSAPVKVYDDLKVTDKHFYNVRAYDLGVYPAVDGLDDLNATILKDLEAAYSLSTDQPSTDVKNIFSVEYKVKNEGRYGILEVTYNFKLTAIKTEPYSETKTYYVDKEANAAISAEAYEAAKKVVEEKPADATDNPEVKEDEEIVGEIDEIVLVPLRSYAEALGYTLAWDAEAQKITILDGVELVTTLAVGKNEYIVDNAVVPLEAAPEIQDGYTYVPVSFFEKVLGAVYSVDEDGEIVITAAPEAEAE